MGDYISADTYSNQQAVGGFSLPMDILCFTELIMFIYFIQFNQWISLYS